MRYALDDHAANKNCKTASFSLDILSSNERPGSRSRDPSRPMRGQYPLSSLPPFFGLTLLRTKTLHQID